MCGGGFVLDVQPLGLSLTDAVCAQLYCHRLHKSRTGLHRDLQLNIADGKNMFYWSGMTCQVYLALEFG